MDITVAKGIFSSKDAEELITQIIHIKIKYHEMKASAGRYDSRIVKMREKQIIQLQKDLFEFQRYIQHNPDKIYLNAGIEIIGYEAQN
ncbi:MAG: hypothetical protein WBJ10_04220 [Daejeonella sp.]|uniref:hypothetical protein n=1 Tax=Daejeonella sp. TaxID=2805397 RepID=UPI003C7548B4